MRTRYSALGSRTGERADPHARGHAQDLPPLRPVRRPPDVHRVRSPGVAALVPVRDHLHERRPVVHPSARGGVQADGESRSQELRKHGIAKRCQCMRRIY